VLFLFVFNFFIRCKLEIHHCFVNNFFISYCLFSYSSLDTNVCWWERLTFFLAQDERGSQQPSKVKLVCHIWSTTYVTFYFPRKISRYWKFTFYINFEGHKTFPLSPILTRFAFYSLCPPHPLSVYCLYIYCSFWKIKFVTCKYNLRLT